MNCAYYLLISDLIMKTTTNSRQFLPYISYIYLHTLCYTKITCIRLTKKIHKTNAQNSKVTQPLRRLCGYCLYKIPLGGTFVRANRYKRYLLHSHARNSLINYISNIIIINYYNHYDIQNIVSFILIILL